MAASAVGVSQPLWRLEPSDFDYASVGKDISRERLHSLVERDDIDRYYGPATLLAYYYGDEEKDFILDRLHFTIAPNAPLDQWWLYFQYNYIAGYLGEQSAIQGMEEIASLMPMDERRFQAIQLLAQNGHFDHFGELHDAIGQSEYMPIVISCPGTLWTAKPVSRRCRGIAGRPDQRLHRGCVCHFRSRNAVKIRTVACQTGAQ